MYIYNVYMYIYVYLCIHQAAQVTWELAGEVGEKPTEAVA